MGALRLAGDVGGTNSRLALAAPDADPRCPAFSAVYRNDAYGDFAALLAAFLADAGAALGACTPERGCLAVAGPVSGAVARLTNRPWTLDADALAAQAGIGTLELVNDFAACGHGIACIRSDELSTWQAGVPEAQGVRLVLGAGTGLGTATLTWANGWQVLAGEGGHVGFAPADARQLRLWQWLHERAARVEVERILSGPGLASLYRYCCAEGSRQDAPDPLAAPDPAAAIAARAADAASVSAQAVALFGRIFGALAGDLAFAPLARGGVFVAGGIAPRLEPLIRDAFIDAFRDKGGHAALSERLPVHLVRDPLVGLYGATALALRG